MIDNAPLTGTEWTTANIDWPHYTYQNRPTVATHAQDVAREAAAARGAARVSVDADDEEYRPSESSSGRNLCLTRGPVEVP